MKKIGIVICLIISLSAWARGKTEKFVMQGKAGMIQADTQGNYSELSAEYLKYKRFSIGMFFDDAAKIFNDDVLVEDIQTGVKGSFRLNNKWYARWKTAISKEEDLFATWQGGVEFHYLYKRIDFLGGVTHYDYQDAGLLQEITWGAEYSMNKIWKFGGRMNIINTTPTANAFDVFVSHRRKNTEYRLDILTGKVVEADNLVGDTTSYDFQYYWNSSIDKMQYKIGPGFEWYDGTVRNEKRLYFNFFLVF